MSPTTHARLGSFLASLLATAASAQGIPDVDPELRARFGFLDPVIHKLAWGTQLLQTTRWTEGAPVSLLVNNPHHARVENLQLQDRRLRGEAISVDGDISGMAAADVDGDQHQDLLLYTNTGRLVVQFRGPKPRENLELELGLPALRDALRCGDIDGDGRPDVAVLVRDQGMRWVTRLVTRPRISPAHRVHGQRVIDFCLRDFDGDQRLDLLVCGNEQPAQLQLKLNLGGGRFGPWILLRSPALRRAFAGSEPGSLATIHARPRRVVEYRLQIDAGSARPALCLHALPPSRESRAFVHGDLDGDGDADLVLADGNLARLSFYMEQDGRFAVHHSPTLAGVRSLALGDLDQDGKLDLVLASPEEKSLAWIPGKAGLQSFPRPLLRLPAYEDEPAQPQAVAVAGQEVFVLVSSGGRSAALLRITGVAAGKPESEQVLRFASMRRTPTRMLLGDFDGQHGEDLAFVVPRQGLGVAFRNAQGGFTALAEGAAGFSAGMAEGALSRVDRDGRQNLLLVRERFARELHFDTRHEVQVVAQDNGPEARPALALGARLGAGRRVFVDRALKQLYCLQDEAPQVTLDLPDIATQQLLPHGEDLLLLGNNGLLRVPFGRSYKLEPLRSFEPLKDSKYFAGLAADFDGDGKKELAILDDELHGLHMLVPQGGKLRRALSFPIFQTNGEGRNEPREIAAGDLNGDGRLDLLLIAHDRILIYPQER